MELLLKNPRIKTKKIATFILRELGCPENSVLSIFFVSNGRIAFLNRKYFKKNALTNVISFPMHYRSPDGKFFLGDIVIAKEVAKKESENAGLDFNERVAQLIIHGILHLIGYKDYNSKDMREMQVKENMLLKELKLFLARASE